MMKKGFTILFTISLFTMSFSQISMLIVQSAEPSSLELTSIIIEGDDPRNYPDIIIKGNGTENDPFILRDTIVDLLQIKNTTNYFLLSNVSLLSLIISHTIGGEVVNCTMGGNGGTGLNCGNCSDMKIHNNTVWNNGVGLKFTNSTNNSIYSNWIINSSKIGIAFYGKCTGNLLYNNYFNNTKNLHLDGQSLGHNTWALTKISLKWDNIVAGPYFGGNYWSDYNGSDTDGDWLGDTEIPHSQVDHLPLIQYPDIERPGIVDDTEGSPTTGDRFNLNATVWDNLGIKVAYAEYWLDNGTHKNITATWIYGHNKSGMHRFDIMVPSGAHILHYNFSVVDVTGFWNRTETNTLNVLDNDAPIIEDYSGTPIASQNFTFNISISDNWGSYDAEIGYWYDDGDPQIIALIKNKTKVRIPSDAIYLYYNITVTDTSDNNAKLTKEKSIQDISPPNITDMSGRPYTGETFTFKCNISENRKIDEVEVKYWFDGDQQGIKDMGHHSGDYNYEYVTYIDVDVRELSYVIKATDTHYNVGITDNRTVGVLDIINPKVLDFAGEPIIGELFNVTISTWDNWEVTAVFFEYWFDDNEHVNESHYPNMTIDIPKNATRMDFKIIAYDSSGNIDTLNGHKKVLDIIPPTIKDLSGNPTTGDDFWIIADIKDNSDIYFANLRYKIDDEPTYELHSFDGKYMFPIPDNGETMYYKIFVTDPSDNYKSLQVEKLIIDDDVPLVKDLTIGTPESAHYFKFDVHVTDNRELSKVCLDYWFEEDEFQKCKYEKLNKPSFKVLIKREWTEIHYSFSAWDSSGNLNVSDEKVLVVSGQEPNNPPVLFPIPNQHVIIGEVFRLRVQANDPDPLAYSNLTYSLRKAPNGMRIDPSSGQITWTPNQGQEGKYEVIAEVTDSIDADRQSFQITVHPKEEMSRTTDNGWIMWIVILTLFIVALVLLARGMRENKFEREIVAEESTDESRKEIDDSEE